MPPMSRTEPRRIDSGTPRDTVYPWGKGINKQKTNKQIKSVCLVKSAVCDVAFGDRRELLHECAKPRPHVAHFAFEIALSGAIMLTLLLVCSFSPKVQKYLLGSPIASLLTNRLSQATVGCLLLAYSFSPRVQSIPRGPLIYVLQWHTLMLDI